MIERSKDRPAYLEHYDLNTAPFLNQLDDQFFYAGSTLMQRLDLLSHLTQFGDAVIVVTGPHGSGKTTLQQHLNKTAKADWTICNLAASQAEQLQHLLAAHLGGYPDAPAKLLLTEWINRSNDNDLLIVMIDDAQFLSQEGIHKLSVLFEDNIIDRTRLILFGTPELTDKVHEALDAQIFKNTAQVLEMPRFSADETSSYLMHRMAVAGYSGENPFTETEIHAITKAADGRPSEINRQAELCLIEGHGRSNLKAIAKRDKRLSMPLIAGLVAGMAMLAGIFGWLYTDNSQNNELVASKQNSLPIPPVKTLEKRSLPMTEPSKKIENAGLIARKTWSEDHDQPDLVETPPKIEKLALPDQPQKKGSETDLAPEKTASSDTTDNTPRKPESVIVPIQRIKITKPEPEPEQTKPAQQKTRPIAANPVGKAKTPSPQPGDKISQREAWLLDQKPDNYTLQLLGARNEKAVRGFIKKHKLATDKTAYYRGLHKGKDWFVVVYGTFANKQDAVQAVKTLPAAIRKAAPWPRKMKAIQASIRFK